MDEVFQKSVKIEDPWLVIDNGKVAHPETGFERSELVELVENDRRYAALAELEYDADPILVGFVPDVRESVNSLVLDHLGNRGDPLCLVDLVGEFGDNDAVPPVTSI